VQGGRRYQLRFHRTQQPAFAELYQVLVASRADNGSVVAAVGPGRVRQDSVGAACETRPAVLLRGRGYFNQEVVGESRYFRELRKLAGATSTGERETTAVLVPEPDNKYDPNAIRVSIEGHMVGYLPREVAESYQAPLRSVNHAGQTAACLARLWWSRERDDFIASVSLDLADPAELLPVNAPDSSSRHVVIPAGRTYQVSGENQHLDVLVPLVRSGTVPGKALAFGTLRIVEKVGARSPHSIIAVCINGHEIGELTKQTSAKLLSIVRALDSIGAECYAEVLLTGNELAVEARLRITPPEELAPDFVAQLRLNEPQGDSPTQSGP
jgi:hypothetical protein